VGLVFGGYMLATPTRRWIGEHTPPNPNIVTIYVAPPVNLTGREALSRGLEHFDDVLQSRLNRMAQALDGLFDKIPRADEMQSATIRLSGAKALDVNGAPVDHPLFDWKTFDGVEMRPLQIDVKHAQSVHENQGGEAPYQVRFSQGEADHVTIEVTPSRTETTDTCRIQQDAQSLFAADRNGVALEAIVDIVASCILGDIVRNKIYREHQDGHTGHTYTDAYGLMFDVRNTEKEVYLLQGVERYHFFATSWQERPEEAVSALNQSIQRFSSVVDTEHQDAVKVSYPIAEYLLAHALTSAAFGPAGAQQGDSNARQALSTRLPVAFSASPFRCALWAKAMAHEAAEDKEGAIPAWQSVVEAASPKAAPADKVGAVVSAPCVVRSLRYTAMGTRVKARTRLLLAYQRGQHNDTEVSGKNLSDTRRALNDEIKRLPSENHHAELASTTDAEVRIESALTKAGFDLDMAVYYLLASLKAGELRTPAAMTPNLIWMAQDGLGELQRIDELSDPDLCGPVPALITEGMSQCRNEGTSCDAPRRALDGYLRAASEWFWEGALRKLMRATQTTRSARTSLCNAIESPDNIAECGDTRTDAGQEKRFPDLHRRVMTGLRLLDDLEATIAVVMRVTRCYAIGKSEPTACVSATQVASIGPSASGAPAMLSPFGTARCEATSNTLDAECISGKERERRWLQRPVYARQLSDARATCALRLAASTSTTGKSKVAEFQYASLLESWAKDPPGAELVRQTENELQVDVRAEVYREKFIPRALFAYATLWPAVESYPRWRSKKINAQELVNEKRRAMDASKWTAEKIEEALMSIFDELVGGSSGTTLAALGQALRAHEEREAGMTLDDADKRFADLLNCRAPGQDGRPPPSCILREAFDAYKGWAHVRATALAGGSADKKEFGETVAAATRQALSVRHEVIARGDRAYEALVRSFFFSDVKQVLKSPHASSIDVQSIRIAFFRVLLRAGSPLRIDRNIQELELRVFAAMLSNTGDMKALEALVSKDPVASLAAQGFVFTHGDHDDDIRSVDEAVAALANEKCSGQHWLGRFLSYVSTSHETYHVSGIWDPHARRAMNLAGNVHRWCSHYGLAIMSEMMMLGDLIEEDAKSELGQSTGEATRVSGVVGGPDFFKYAFARFLLTQGRAKEAYDIAKNLDHVEGKILTARSLLATGSVGQAAVLAGRAVRSFEAACDYGHEGCGEAGLVLDGSIYRTLGDAALMFGNLGGQGSAAGEDKRPHPEYYEAVRAYQKALERGSMEEAEVSAAGIALRLAAAYLEVGDDNAAVRSVDIEKGADRGCRKAKLLKAIARWGRGERDVGREASGGDAALSPFDFDTQRSNPMCPSDAVPVHLGSRAKALRQILLYERSQMALARSPR
jgi:tetratricopeptide (TPR) repeat protein